MEDCLVTVTYPLMITRDDGLTFKLNANSQHCVEEEGYYQAPYEYLTKPDGTGYGYKILSGDSFFILFSPMISFEGFERTGLDMLDIGERRRVIRIDPLKDPTEATLKYLGHDIRKCERTDYNGRWLQKVIAERYNTKPD